MFFVKGWSTWCTNNSLIPCYGNLLKLIFFQQFKTLILYLDDFCNEEEVKSVAQSMFDNGLTKLGYKWILLEYNLFKSNLMRKKEMNYMCL